jgi:hypothetical protein
MGFDEGFSSEIVLCFPLLLLLVLEGFDSGVLKTVA